MLSWAIQTAIMSIILIFLVHHLISFFTLTLTVPKIKDLVNTSTQKYEHMFKVISNSNTTTNSNIADIKYQGKRLRIDFLDGSGYEYFGVPENTYIKLVNADSQGRFARRHIYTSFLYRNVSKSALVL